GLSARRSSSPPQRPSSVLALFLSPTPRPPRSPLFPYTTLFRSLPGGAPVPRDPEAAAGPAALEMPRLHLELPHPGEQRVGVAGVDGEVRAAGVRVHEQRAGPGPAAVRGAVHATLLLGPVGAPQCAHEHDVGA